MVEFHRASNTMSSSPYERWEEVYVSSDKGRREVQYYLKRRNEGGLDLAVVGKEKRLRHFSYDYAFLDNKESLLQCRASSLVKLRSRREVIDWLNSIVNPEFQVHGPVTPTDEDMEFSDANNQGSDVVKELDRLTNEFMWLGSAWTCRKRRRHYQSFHRNGVKIAVHDFVYVLAEEGGRLVAHLDDMYEDLKGNRMVVVQWFHKIEEVGIVLPQNYDDREIFFSLCLQDLSIECIDGLAIVLSPEHYELFLNEATHTQLEPFVCHRQFDNDEVKRFDITQVKGYWKQGLVRHLSSDTPLKHQPVDYGLRMQRHLSNVSGNRPRKRLHWSEECDTRLHSVIQKVDVDTNVQNCSHNLVSSKDHSRMFGLKEQSTSFSEKSALEHKNEHLRIGSQVEVLSQDSGIRGCWFRALIIKKHLEKVKVKYQDIMDAADEAKNLEEWVMASRVAAPDELGIRVCGRTIVRPAPLSNCGEVSSVYNVGTIVDVWQHGGWWEGIVVKKECEDRVHVYFPGESKELIFSCGELRHSKEWLENGWKQLKERSDFVSRLSGPEKKQCITNSNSLVLKVDQGNEKLTESTVARDLSKDDLLSQLKWRSSGRRRRSRSPVHKLHSSVPDGKSHRDSHKSTYERFFKISSMKVDPDNCKDDSRCGSSVLSSLTNLVMSR